MRYVSADAGRYCGCSQEEINIFGGLQYIEHKERLNPNIVGAYVCPICGTIQATEEEYK